MKAAPKPELLAPAGDKEKLEAALHFGADAVYLSGASFGLRKAAKNFDREELVEAVTLAHQSGVKVHVTMNLLPHDRDWVGLLDYAHFLDRIGVDAVIVSDPGIFMALHKETELKLHVSTQASVASTATVNFWAGLGARRIVLARELSLEEIQTIRKGADPAVELEVFVHGAMCISYSGRCLLSNYMTGRDANQGDCAQACRWKYALVEATRPDQAFPIVEEGGESFIFNSKDLCLLPYLKELVEAGVSSFKIEGRVKSAFYVATVVHAYRRALDLLASGQWGAEAVQVLLEELAKTSHRSFTSGFLLGPPGPEGQNYQTTSYIQDYAYLGTILAIDPNRRRMEVEVRNPFSTGEQVELLRSQGPFSTYRIEAIEDEKGTPINRARVPLSRVWLPLAEGGSVGDLLRKKKA